MKQASLAARRRAADGWPPQAWITRLDPPLAGAADGPLAGLRFAVKDNIDVAGVPTTAACPAFARTAGGARRTWCSACSMPVRACVGKTNLDQFACGLNGTRSPYGAVPNSFDARYVSGGSSSGSAYVVATGQVDFALGTDTAGSGRVPAGLNNIVGLKPSRGPDQRARRGAGGAERRLRVDLRAHRGAWPRACCRRRWASTRRIPYSRQLDAGDRALARALPLRRAVGAAVLRRRASAEPPSSDAIDAAARRWAARRSPIDYAPLAAGRRAALRQRAGGRALRRRARRSSTRTKPT